MCAQHYEKINSIIVPLCELYSDMVYTKIMGGQNIAASRTGLSVSRIYNLYQSVCMYVYVYIHIYIDIHTLKILCMKFCANLRNRTRDPSILEVLEKAKQQSHVLISFHHY